ncbi:hypothetical protein [Georgenia deserti]|uniref:Secreted protein n=1 Tax=Georgenia deserti TaxID=2093781 RepID=A0ABW4L948_9MICO
MGHRRMSFGLWAIALAAGLTAAVPGTASADEPAETAAQPTAQGCGKVITQPGAGETRYWWHNCRDGYGGDYVEVDIIWLPDKYYCVPPGQTWNMGSSWAMGPQLGNVRDVSLVKTDCPY